MGESGAGHFVKMIHNGIEYGMMQALAEGFSILKKSPFRFRLKDVAKVYNQNSIISSRLTSWLQEGYEKYGEDLKAASGTVAHTGEGEWTVKTAKELGIPTPTITGAFDFRIQSKKKPNYTGKILSMLRAVFGGHRIQ
jgi:6-phosphogluconate dehydrogenase